MPMSVFSRLQLHKKPGWWNKFKSRGENKRAKQAE